MGSGAGTGGAAAAWRGPEPSGAASAATSAADAAAADAGAVWEPEAGTLRHLDSTALRRCFGRPHVWIHLVGDSTVRFMCALARVEGEGEGCG